MPFLQCRATTKTMAVLIPLFISACAFEGKKKTHPKKQKEGKQRARRCGPGGDQPKWNEPLISPSCPLITHPLMSAPLRGCCSSTIPYVALPRRPATDSTLPHTHTPSLSFFLYFFKYKWFPQPPRASPAVGWHLVRRTRRNFTVWQPGVFIHRESPTRPW